MTKFLIKLFIKDNQDVTDTAIRQKYGVLGGLVGILCNALLFTAKFIAGMLTSSIAVTADAFNNLSDAGSSIITLVGFRMAGRPADEEHPFGHGRIEYVSGFIVSLAIMLVGVELLKSSAQKIMAPEEITFSVLSFVIMIGSILLKLWMCLFNRKLGRTINSAAMKATAMDSLSDVIATSTVVVGMAVSYFTGLNIDGFTGIIVALFILYTGFTTARDTINPLLGQAPDAEFVSGIEQEVLSYEQIVGIHDLIVHNYGPGRSVVSLHAEVFCNVDIIEIHDVIDMVERDLKKKFNCEVVIHMDPIITDDRVTNCMRTKMAALVRLIDPALMIHDFRMSEEQSQTNLIFDVVVPHKFRLSDQEVVQAVRETIKEIDPHFEVVINVDKSYHYQGKTK